ncbi:MAG: Stp1/IreP family PP2C-type Ser/Thr phosphatase [Clostridia bacterium]|nr:Stp1/IreP family PP2C-type Ser/Thr phosphatase [Clostridia bacterium]
MQAWSKTDIGRKRRENQDSTYVKLDYEKNIALLVVCDGMGGVNGGSEASSLAIESFVDFIWDGIREESSDEDVVLILRNAVTAANRAVFSRAVSDPAFMGMGTTLTAALVIGSRGYVVNVGDSRTYRIGDGIRQITEDHSLAGDLFRNGTITREQFDSYPNKNIITRAVGTDPEVYGDIFKLALTEGEGLLLCSDGLTNMLSDEEILKVVNEAESEEAACEKLVDLANEAGGRDNVSVVLFRA